MPLGLRFNFAYSHMNTWCSVGISIIKLCWKGGFLAELVVERWCVGPRPITSSIWVGFGGGPWHTINSHVTKKCTQSSPSPKVAHSWDLTRTDVGPVDLYLIQSELGPGKVFKPWMSQSAMPIISGWVNYV